MEITQQLKEIEKAALREIETSRSLKEVQDLRIRYLGRKSRITWRG